AFCKKRPQALLAIVPPTENSERGRVLIKSLLAAGPRGFAKRTLRNIGTVFGDQSGFAPENFTTFAHFSVSSAMNLPNSAGVIGIGTPPRPASRALIVGSARPALIASLSLSIICDVGFLGAPTPYQALAS